jgi:energy-coupling factor transport system ATP-binding protein
MSALKVDNLHFRYPGDTGFLFDGLTLSVDAGHSCLIVGDNGSGKTTLGKLITGLLTPESGTVQIGGRSVHGERLKARSRLAIYQGQISHLECFCSSIAAEIAFGMKQSGFTGSLETWYLDFSLPANRALKPLDLPMTDLWRLQLLILGVLFNPVLLFIDEVMAANAALQLHALKSILRHRSENGLVTIVSYQRPIQAPFDQTLLLEDSRLKSP